MKRYADAKWLGGLKDGKGTLTTESGVLEQAQYSFGTRFENGIGTNPEELIAAAHAGCFSMAFAAQLEAAGFTAEKIQIKAVVSIEKSDDGFVIPLIHLDVNAKIPNIDNAEFQKIINAAKVGCPVSKLMNAEITLEANLEK